MAQTLPGKTHNTPKEQQSTEPQGPTQLVGAWNQQHTLRFDSVNCTQDTHTGHHPHCDAENITPSWQKMCTSSGLAEYNNGDSQAHMQVIMLAAGHILGLVSCLLHHTRHSPGVHHAHTDTLSFSQSNAFVPCWLRHELVATRHTQATATCSVAHHTPISDYITYKINLVLNRKQHTLKGQHPCCHA